MISLRIVKYALMNLDKGHGEGELQCVVTRTPNGDFSAWIPGCVQVEDPSLMMALDSIVKKWRANGCPSVIDVTFESNWKRVGLGEL